MNHTPTPLPWVISPKREESNKVVIGTGPDAWLGLAAVYGDTQEEAEANAEFIVKAVTCHEELLAALHAVVKWLDFAQAKLGNAEELDRNIRKYGARKWIKQFGEGAGHRAKEARAVIARAEQ